MRGVWWSAAFCALALAWAAVVWRSPTTATMQPGSVVALDCRAGELEKVRVETPTKTIAIAFADRGASAWIEVEQPVAGAVAPPDGVTPTQRRAFAASERIARVVEALAPLRAQRSLGEPSDDRRAALGLEGKDATGERVTVVCGGREVAFDVGKATYGAGGRALRRVGEGEVYLVSESALADVRMADLRFMQRELIAVAPDRLESAQVRWLAAPGGAVELALTHKNRHQPGRDDWVATAEPERRNEMYGNWLASLLRLRLIDYLSPDAEPGSELKPPAPSEPIVEVRFAAEPPQRFELRRADSATGAIYYARSTSTRAWVNVSRGAVERLIADLPALFGLPAATAAATPAPRATAATPTDAR